MRYYVLQFCLHSKDRHRNTNNNNEIGRDLPPATLCVNSTITLQPRCKYRKFYNISRILVGNEIVDLFSWAMIQLHLHSRLNTWLQWNGQWQLQDEKRKKLKFWGIWCSYIRDLTVIGCGGIKWPYLTGPWEMRIHVTDVLTDFLVKMLSCECHRITGDHFNATERLLW